MDTVFHNIDTLISKHRENKELVKDLDKLKEDLNIYEDKIHEEVEIKEHLYTSLLDNLPEMDVYLFNQNLQFLLTGGKEKLKYGYAKNEFTGESIKNNDNKYFNDILLPLCKDTLQGNVSQSEVKYKGKYYKVISQPVLNKDGKVEYGIIISHSITRLKKTQNKLKKAKEEAENVAKAKSTFLANMSHEIRTPLNAIIGFSEQLSKTKLTAVQTRYNDLVIESSDHLLSLVSEILILLKIDMDKVYLENIPFDIRKVFKDTYEFFRIRAENKGVELIFLVDNNVPSVLLGDPFRLKQILINLVGNAIKFTEVGSVRLYCAVKKVTKDKVIVQTIVRDTGIGFSKKDADIIFDEFTQASNMVRENHGGTGLGLTISKKLVELQKGRISVKSELNKGSSFTVVLPYSKGQESDLIVDEPNYMLSNHFLKGFNVLLADDDTYNRELAKIVFEKWGVKLDLACDGMEALDLVQKKKYNLILMDIHMPRADGTQVSKYIRSEVDCLNFDTKIVAVTANVVKDDIVKYMKSGMDDYIIKPFKEEELYNKICNVLELNREGNKQNDYMQQENKTTFHLGDISHKRYDLNDLLAATKGNALMFNKMLQTFLDNITVALKQFDDSLSKEDWGTIRETAHRMVSSVKYFRMEELAQELKEIEQLIVAEEVENLELKIENTCKEMNQMVKVLKDEML